jgi:hypothetical protein
MTIDLRAAAFGDQPDATITVTEDAPARDRWLAAVALGGQGHYARAAALLRPLLTGPDATVAALAGATLASHLRQLGGHGPARRFDAEAARRLTTPQGRSAANSRLSGVSSVQQVNGRHARAASATSRHDSDPDRADRAGAQADEGVDRADVLIDEGVDRAGGLVGEGADRAGGLVGVGWTGALVGEGVDRAGGLVDDGVGRAGALVDVLLGLAADSIGLHRPAQARRMHDAATRAGRGGGWRVTVRIDWVATELALATDDPAGAAGHAARALAVSTAAGATRHTVKSTMMLGAALASGGTPDGRSRAEGLLTEALTTSLTRGMLPLAWPCALLLADLVPDRAAERTLIVSNALTCILTRSDAEMRRIALASAWLPASLIRSGDPLERVWS